MKLRCWRRGRSFTPWDQYTMRKKATVFPGPCLCTWDVVTLSPYECPTAERGCMAEGLRTSLDSASLTHAEHSLGSQAAWQRVVISPCLEAPSSKTDSSNWSKTRLLLFSLDFVILWSGKHLGWCCHPGCCSYWCWELTRELFLKLGTGSTLGILSIGRGMGLTGLCFCLFRNNGQMACISAVFWVHWSTPGPKTGPCELQNLGSCRGCDSPLNGSRCRRESEVACSLQEATLL